MNNVIYPCLWFDGNAKEAADFYCSVFPNSEITNENPMVSAFESSGQKFMCLNGGSEFKINPSISFFVVCENEQEFDCIWSRLLDGGSVLMPLDKYDWSEKYGWLQDRFGVSWQVSIGKISDFGQKFTPYLMFTDVQNGRATEAVGFYTSVFENSSITAVHRHEKGEDAGNVMHAQFKLSDQAFMAMDSAYPHGFTFNEAVSLVIECDTQKEIDYFWSKLTLGGEESMCGWLKDKFGVSWQVVPAILEKLMSDPAKSERVLDAFMQMKKFNIDQLLEAYEDTFADAEKNIGVNI